MGGAKLTMDLHPRYREPAVIDVSALITDPTVALIRQRARLCTMLSELSADEWATPSRCAGWSVQDVAEHLVSVNRYWLFSIGAGLQGEPTRLLESFDPVAVPAAIVEGARGAAPSATLEKLAASNDDLRDLLRSVSGDDWAKPAEAPPGHIALGAVCAHALWDAWIHERDVLLPLGGRQPVEPDEVATSLVYVTALAPAIYLNAGKNVSGTLTMRARRPDLDFTVEVDGQARARPAAQEDAGALVEGDAVDLVEMISARAPLPDLPSGSLWLVDGLHHAFDAG